MKPFTWILLIWGVLCGAASSGHFVWSIDHVLASLACMLMAGPLLTGYTQTINDYYDRELDAINEPYRPIPSGAIGLGQVQIQIWVLLIGGIAVSYGLDRWANHEFPILTVLSLGGSFISYIYSAPPLKLKQNGWLGNYALGASYIALPWWCGQAMFGHVGEGAAGGELTPPVVLLTALYSFAGLGIAIVNDFKSVEGDAKLGLRSLPVEFGVDTAKYLCAGLIDVTQLGVASYLFALGETTYALILLGLIAPQILAQFAYLLKDPVQFDVKYQANAQPFLVLGLLDTALAGGHHGGASLL